MIIGETTILSGIRKSDFEFLYNCSNDPEVKFRTGTLFPVSEFEHDKWISSRNNESNKFFIILDKETYRPVGYLGLKNIDYINSNAELFISIAKEFIGKKGYGSSAINSLIDFCFMRMNLHKIYLHVFESNKKAIKTNEYCGFKIEGRLVDHHFNNGRYESLIVMGILRKG